MGWTFTAVTIAWVFFRADSIAIALEYLTHSLQSMAELPSRPSLSLMFFITGLISLDYCSRNAPRTPFQMPSRWLRWPLYFGIAFVVMQRFSNPASFLYFQF